MDHLSPRERQVQQCIDQGVADARQIAAQLNLSYSSVCVYRSTMRKKLGLPSLRSPKGQPKPRDNTRISARRRANLKLDDAPAIRVTATARARIDGEIASGLRCRCGLLNPCADHEVV